MFGDMEAKFKTGDRVVVLHTYDSLMFRVDPGSIGTVDEDDCTSPWVKFDNPEFNYTGMGTAIPEDEMTLL